MTLSEFSFRVILLFIPGIISFFVADKLTHHKETPLHKTLLLSLIYGFAGYFIYYIIFVFAINNLCMLCSDKLPDVGVLRHRFNFSFISSLTDLQGKLSFAEIGIVTALSFPIGLFIAFLINHKILFRLAHVLTVSKKFGDVDVWSFVMNLENSDTVWVVVRDMNYDLMYAGWVQAFSDSTDNDEMFLRDVRVFKNSTGERLYDVPGMYLPRKREGLTIELPGLPFYKNDNGDGKEVGKNEQEQAPGRSSQNL